MCFYLITGKDPYSEIGLELKCLNSSPGTLKSNSETIEGYVPDIDLIVGEKHIHLLGHFRHYFSKRRRQNIITDDIFYGI